MITDADRALVRTIKAGKVLDGAWDAMRHREEAYALGRIEGGKAMQDYVVETCQNLANISAALGGEPAGTQAIRAVGSALEGIDHEDVAKGRP